MSPGRKIAAAIGCCLMALALSGCGGITASPSFSPASLLIPGFIQNTEPKPEIVPAAHSWEVASVDSIRK
jgi:hypothetical protein